ncbi:lysophospholipid acyltransferase family protein [Spirillospora sp. CA-294931]|uniref:lysophospholipid acyltransferase family protein n=1 Tax=Spirillospora sp. CA-294931 TaxID=3240042 RepID=UPI003D946B86
MPSPAEWTPPPERLIRAADLALEPWRAWTSPVFHGLDNLPDHGPALLVGNHTVYGVVDAPLIFFEIYRRRGVWVRSLADRVHWQIPGWRKIMDWGGSADGTPDACRAMLDSGAMVVVFPGGAREASRDRDQAYRLQWEGRLGFARLAVEAGCPIVPFGTVGVEEMFTTLVDARSPLLAPGRALGRLVLGERGRRDDAMLPISRGIGLTPIPRAQRLYYGFGRPIDTTAWKGRQNDDQAVAEVRDLTAKAVQDIIETLRAEQSTDPGRTPLGRLGRTLGRGIGLSTRLLPRPLCR